MVCRFMRHDAWQDALFVHYAVDAERLQQRLPPELLVDHHDGIAYVGIVCISELGIVPFPPGVPLWMVRWLGLSHDAVNVRTYVRPASGNGPPGIYFFSLDCSSLLPTIGARLLFGLRYRYSRMARRRPRNDGALRMESNTLLNKATMAVEWLPQTEPTVRADRDAALGRFFVERYALYNEPSPLLRLFMPRGASLWYGTITHEPWPLRKAKLLAYGGFCSGVGILASVGLAEIVTGGAIAHTSSGVGPIEFFWQGQAV